MFFKHLKVMNLLFIKMNLFSTKKAIILLFLIGSLVFYLTNKKINQEETEDKELLFLLDFVNQKESSAPLKLEKIETINSENSEYRILLSQLRPLNPKYKAEIESYITNQALLNFKKIVHVEINDPIFAKYKQKIESLFLKLSNFFNNNIFVDYLSLFAKALIIFLLIKYIFSWLYRKVKHNSLRKNSLKVASLIKENNDLKTELEKLKIEFDGINHFWSSSIEASQSLKKQNELLIKENVALKERLKLNYKLINHIENNKERTKERNDNLHLNPKKSEPTFELMTKAKDINIL